MTILRNLGKFAWILIAAVVIGHESPEYARAEILYGTEFAGQQIVRIDTSTNSVTTVSSTPGSPDSMVFYGANDIIYTDETSETLRDLNLVTHTDTVLSASVGLPADLTLTPDLKNVLVSDFIGGRILEYNFQTKMTSVFASPGGNPEGLVFDGSGRLFANLGLRSVDPPENSSPSLTRRPVQSCTSLRAWIVWMG